MTHKLNPDAYAFITLQDEYRKQMTAHEEAQGLAKRYRVLLERAEADALTAAERATSIMETMLKLDQPKDAEKSA